MNRLYFRETDFLKLVQATMDLARLARDEEGLRLGPEPRADSEHEVSVMLKQALRAASGAHSIIVKPYPWGHSGGS